MSTINVSQGMKGYLKGRETAQNMVCALYAQLCVRLSLYSNGVRFVMWNAHARWHYVFTCNVYIVLVYIQVRDIQYVSCQYLRWKGSSTSHSIVRSFVRSLYCTLCHNTFFPLLTAIIVIIITISPLSHFSSLLWKWNISFDCYCCVDSVSIDDLCA